MCGAASGLGVVTLAACGAGSQRGAADGGTPVAGPTEITWSKQLIGPPQDDYWFATWKAASEATGVKVTPLAEPGADYWTKRQAEFAGGTAAVDLMTTNSSWVIPGGVNGMFVDYNPLLKRDKIDPKIFYKADLDTWTWKGQLWSIPSQSGGEVVLYNKRLFQAKGVPFPNKNWTYDDLLQACQRLNDPANNKVAIEVGQNVLHYMGATFLMNFGGKVLSEGRDKALYGDDPLALQGAQFDVDLHQKYRVTPTEAARAAVPPGGRLLDNEITAMEINGLFRRATAQPALGTENLDFAPPQKGPKGIQRASVAGNAWSMLKLSKAQESAWKVHKWIYTTKEGQATPQIKAVAWPPLIATANSPMWLDQFKGTHIADCAKVWETGGHDIMPLPEGPDGYKAMNDPWNDALSGKIGAREALQQSAAAANELFSRRPAAFR
jgi:multiple sugar transport system substrate-binding protein